MLRSLAASAAIIALLAACQQPGQSGGINKEQVGTIGGAILGGVLGSKVGKGTGNGIAIGAGTLLGAYLGSETGKSLDRADMNFYNRTSQKALETGQPGETLPWSNPKTGNRGTVTPQRYYQQDDGRYCREYQQSITVGGKKQEGYGTACRQPDGSWEVVTN